MTDDPEGKYLQAKRQLSCYCIVLYVTVLYCMVWGEWYDTVFTHHLVLWRADPVRQEG